MGPTLPRSRVSSAQAGRSVSSCQTSATPGSSTTRPGCCSTSTESAPRNSRNPAGTVRRRPPDPEPGVVPPQVQPARRGAVHLVRGRGVGGGAAEVALQHPGTAVAGDLVVLEAGAGAEDGDVAGGHRDVVVPAVVQGAGQNHGDDVDGAVLVPAVAGPRLEPVVGHPEQRPERAVAGREDHPLLEGHDVGRSAAWCSARTPKISAVSRLHATPERPAADDVGEEVHAQPHPGQADEHDERHPGGERPVPGPAGEQRPGEDQRDRDQGGDARRVPAREAQRVVPRAALGEVGPHATEHLLEQRGDRADQHHGGDQPCRRPPQLSAEEQHQHGQEDDEPEPRQPRRGEELQQQVQRAGPVVPDVERLADRRVQAQLRTEVRPHADPEQHEQDRAADDGDPRRRRRPRGTRSGDGRGTVRGNAHRPTLPDPAARDTLAGWTAG